MDKVLILDPGLVNLKSAMRGTLSVVISFFAVSFLAKHFHQPPTLAFMGVLIAMLGSMAVSDALKKDQQKTFLILPLPVGVALALSIGLESQPVLRAVGFLLITFLAVFLRRYGPRGVAIGLITFMSYFCPLFFPVHVNAIPGVLGAEFIATAITFVVRFYVIPERPERDLKLFLRSFQAQVRVILERVVMEVRQFAAAPVPQKAEELLRSRARLQSLLTRLNETGLSLEGLLGDSSRTESLHMHVFERELSVRYFLDTVSRWVVRNQERPERLQAGAAHLDKLLQGTSGDGGEDASLSEMKMALKAVLSLESQPVVSSVSQSDGMAKSKTPAKIVSTEKWYQHVSTRQALQATVATGLASAAGFSISPDRWYWASMTAFVVFAGATRGETLVRAFLRVAGTLAGLLLGFLAAYALSGHHALEWSLVILSIFVAIYGARSAFGFWTAGMFTLMLALLYDVLGQLTEKVLVLRLEETLVGSVIGAVIAAYMLPTKTSSSVRNSFQKFLLAVAGTLEELSKRLQSPFARRDLIRHLRDLDRELVTLRTAAMPILGKLSILRRGDIPATVYEASVLVHFLRHLATYMGPRTKMTDEEISARCLLLAQEARALAANIEFAKPRDVQVSAGNEPVVQADDDLPKHWFSRVQQIFDHFQQSSLLRGSQKTGINP